MWGYPFHFDGIQIIARASDDYEYTENIDIRVDEEADEDDWAKKVEVVRENFAEVWIWQTSGNGRFVFGFLVHDSITSNPTGQ